MRTGLLAISFSLWDVAVALGHKDPSPEVVGFSAILFLAAIIMDVVDFVRGMRGRR